MKKPYPYIKNNWMILEPLVKVDRLTKNMAIMQEYIGLLNQQKFGKKAEPNSLPGSLLDKAVTYALNQWSYFENVLKDGRLELTNNLAKRQIRPVTIGRKNWRTMETPRWV